MQGLLPDLPDQNTLLIPIPSTIDKAAPDRTDRDQFPKRIVPVP
ncbi:hypothetical protein EKH55_3969 [Sinorhizobium alkalisoli]|nr:hypothetical protein EKH55_3969 [Sinorhizobium alkalisoli]